MTLAIAKSTIVMMAVFVWSYMLIEGEYGKAFWVVIMIIMGQSHVSAGPATYWSSRPG